MDLQIFLRELEAMLEVGPNSLTGNEVLKNMEAWDSMAILGFIALVDNKFHKKILLNDLTMAKSVNDLYSLVS